MHSIRILPLGRILIERIEEFVLSYRIDGFLKEAYILFYTHIQWIIPLGYLCTSLRNSALGILGRYHI